MISDNFQNLGRDLENALGSGFGSGNPFGGDVSRLDPDNLGRSLFNGVLGFVPGGSLIGDIFGGLIPGESAPHKFAQLAYDWVKKIMTEMPSMYANDNSKLLTEMDKHLSYVVSAYTTWVKTSKGGYNSNTSQGHRMGLEFAKKSLRDFRNSINGLKSQYNVSFNEVPSKVLPNSLPFMPNPFKKKMRDDIVGGYRKYTVTPKTVDSGVKVEYKTVVKDGVETKKPDEEIIKDVTIQ